MTLWRSFAVRESRRLPDADAAAVWAVVADPSRLGEWATSGEADWSGDLPEVEDRFTARVRLGPLSRRLRFRIDRWEAGHGFRLRVAGIPLVRSAMVNLEMEADRPDAPAVSLTLSGDTLPPFLPLVVATAGRWASRCLQRLEGLEEIDGRPPSTR